jgi:hypothetical protein
VTNGQLGDLAAAWKYRQYLERREQAYMTSILANTWRKRPISVQDIAGIWANGGVTSKEDFIEKWKAKRRRGKEGRNGKNKPKDIHRR